MTFAPSAATMTSNAATSVAVWAGPQLLDGVVPAVQDAAILNGIFVEAHDGDLEAQAAALGASVRRIEIPAEPAARRDFLAQWSAGNALWRRGLPLSLLLLPLAACGGGGGGGTTGASGIVIDGYVAGATVFRDTNRNGVRDAGEASVTTNATGQFANLGGSSADPIVAFGGTDVNTGAPFVGIMRAPGTATVISPLTTLVAALQQVDPTLTTAQGVSKVQTALGLGTADILNADLGAGNLSQALVPALKANVQVANLIAAVGGGTNGEAIATRFAQMINANQAVDLTNAASVQNLITTSTVADNVNAAAISNIVSTQNQMINNAVNATGVMTAQANQTDTYSIAQFKALNSQPSVNTYVIADTTANIQTAAASGDRSILLSAKNVVASDNSLTLSAANLTNLTAKLLSQYSVSDTGTNITAASDALLDGARAIAVTSGLAELTLSQAAKATMSGGATYRLFDSTLSIQNAIATAVVTGAAQIQTNDVGTLSVPVSLADNVVDSLYAVSDSAVNIQAAIDGGAALRALLTGAESIQVVGSGQAALERVPVDIAQLISSGSYNIVDSGDAINLSAGSNALANAGTVTVQGTDSADALSMGAITRSLIINGLGGDDSLVGGSGSDTISGGAGSDVLEGGAGADTLIGGAGDDILRGDGGADRFVFSTSTAQGGLDDVIDFTTADGDVIDFAFGGAGELAQSDLFGNGTLFAKVAAGGQIGPNTGLVVITDVQANILTQADGEARALVLANGLLPAQGASFANGDALMIAFSDGTDTGIFVVRDSAGDQDLQFDSAQLLVVLDGVSNAGALNVQNFIDFALPVQPG